jgi:hypothetical protein
MSQGAVMSVGYQLKNEEEKHSQDNSLAVD